MGQLANQTERKITHISFMHKLHQSKPELSIFKIMYLFVCFGCTRSLLLHGLSLVAARGGYSLVVVLRLLLWWLLLGLLVSRA